LLPGGSFAKERKKEVDSLAFCRGKKRKITGGNESREDVDFAALSYQSGFGRSMTFFQKGEGTFRALPSGGEGEGLM